MDWWIILFVIALFAALAFTLYGRRRRTGIGKHPVGEDGASPEDRR